MTRRAWVFLAIGLAAAAALAGVALAQRGPGEPIHPTASWNLYAPEEWQRLVTQAHVADLHVVAATAKENGAPVALLAGRRGAATCFVPTDGTRLGRATCDPHAPLTVFSVRDGAFVDVLGIARRDVASVAQTAHLAGTRSTEGAALVPLGRYFVFGSGVRGRGTTLTAHDAGGGIVARIHLRR